MNNNFEEYKKELSKELQDFFEKEKKLPRDNSNSESEWKYSKETRKKLNKEVQEIYKRLQKKYNIKFDNTQE